MEIVYFHVVNYVAGNPRSVVKRFATESLNESTNDFINRNGINLSNEAVCNQFRSDFNLLSIYLRQIIHKIM